MASVSTDSDSDYEKIAKFCLDSHHHTPTRATRFIFEISEVSRAFSHEFVRHEIGLGKVQRSQRYVNEDGFQYVTPAGIASVLVPIQVPIFDVNGNFEKNVMTWLDFDEYQKIAQQMYKRYVEEGIKAEDARYGGRILVLHRDAPELLAAVPEDDRHPSLLLVPVFRQRRHVLHGKYLFSLYCI
jgi:thymidylate synthase ThyX